MITIKQANELELICKKEDFTDLEQVMHYLMHVKRQLRTIGQEVSPMMEHTRIDDCGDQLAVCLFSKIKFDHYVEEMVIYRVNEDGDFV